MLPLSSPPIYCTKPWYHLLDYTKYSAFNLPVNKPSLYQKIDTCFWRTCWCICFHHQSCFLQSLSLLILLCIFSPPTWYNLQSQIFFFFLYYFFFSSLQLTYFSHQHLFIAKVNWQYFFHLINFLYFFKIPGLSTFSHLFKYLLCYKYHSIFYLSSLLYL